MPDAAKFQAKKKMVHIRGRSLEDRRISSFLVDVVINPSLEQSPWIFEPYRCHSTHNNALIIALGIRQWGHLCREALHQNRRHDGKHNIKPELDGRNLGFN
ncbi:hypothetical protein R1flu_027468 [Riccia fluitans]|uniref:Ribosomal protein S14 n=1 Tax=Riccia fluitans TaxID=41844 RepID=A0ABD1XIZ7_9MARC